MEFRVGEKLLKHFEVTDIKRGGFGIVYILHDLESKRLYAFKSFQDKYFKSRRVVEDFYREAETWVKLGKHRNIVEALGVIQIEGKPHILIEYVDGGNLRDRLVRGRVSVLEAMFFAIQFCQGMINAKYIELSGEEKGIVHRDIKPENIMLTKDDVVKITDFGLVKALDEVVEGVAGTPEYMSPEQFMAGIPYMEGIAVDSRSDIYSFGVVLYEMLTGKRPFEGPGLEEYAYQHMYQALKPPRQINPDIPATLEETVLKCLEKEINGRYQSFEELREELMKIYKVHFREIPEMFRAKEKKSTRAERMYAVGASLRRLGKQEEAIRYFERALEIDPKCAMAWAGKGASLDSLDMISDAVRCYDRALEIDPRLSHVWNNKGISLERLNMLDQALKCYEKALEIDPKFFVAWVNKANALKKLGRADEAITCYDRALEVNPEYVPAWLGKGNILFNLGRFKEALQCFDKVLERDFKNAEVLKMKGACLLELNRADEALLCFERAIQIESPFEDASLWLGKGLCLERLGRFEEAIECCDKAIEYEPRYAAAWILKANCLHGLGRFEESNRCYERAVNIRSRTER